MPITKTLSFLPAVFQSDANKKFLGATLDQLVTEPNVSPISGYVGRKFTPGWSGITGYIREPNKERATYQLEPTTVVKNVDTNEVMFESTYPDVLQKINYFGGNVSNQNNLWSSEYYSYNPQINIDAFINYRQYYWLPNGPEAVDVYAGTADTEETYYVYPDNAAQVYNMSGFQTVSNPDLVLVRGGTYQFSVNQTGKPFYIQTSPGLSGRQPANNNLSSRSIYGVTNNGDDVGTVTFTVPTATAQDNYINMPVVQNVDFATDAKYSEIQSLTLSRWAQIGGFDGVSAYNLVNNKFLIFNQYFTSSSDWTDPSTSTVVPSVDRYGVWQITLTPSGGDYIIDLQPYAAIPTSNKVIITSGIYFGNTEYYKNSTGYLAQVPVITAPLDTLYYQDGVVEGQFGTIRIIDSSSNLINVSVDILGKQNYISPNKVIFTNGLKIKFDSSVIPSSYQNNEYYVDGVGTAISLVLVSDLDTNYAISRANYQPHDAFVAAANAAINPSGDQLTINSNAYPISSGIYYGQFPNAVNPEYISVQDLTFSYPYRGGQYVQGDDTSNLLRTGFIGSTVVGIPIKGPTNEWYIPQSDGSVWHYDTDQVLINGQDEYYGYPDADGVYHYHSSEFITANAWAAVDGFTASYQHSDGHSKIVGFAADGYPIYGPYGYSDANNPYSGVIKMRSSYVASTGTTNRPQPQTVTVTANTTIGANVTVSSTYGLNPGMRITVNSAGLPTSSYWIVNCGNKTAIGPKEYTAGSNQVQLNSNVVVYAGSTLTFEFLAGAFIEDYEYVETSGTLDQYNGRYCVTPDFPMGTYAYFGTQDSTGNPTYPYFVGRSFFGSLSVDSNSSLTTPDYIVINRSSRDRNPWSRKNRWFHQSVIETSALFNNVPFLLESSDRAQRPIIEFNADLQLFDFGKTGLTPVDIYDTNITTPFTTVEGATGVYLDGVNVVNNMRVIFAADTDANTKNKIYVVKFIDVDSSSATAPVIHLELAADGDVAVNDTVSILNGLVNAGKSYYYTGTAWDEGQNKSTVNQAPMFDIIDSDGTSFSDRSVYPLTNTSTDFYGNKIFSYKVGTGSDDAVLGFPLSYRNIDNQGDIEFENNYDTETFSYSLDRVDYSKKINLGYIYKNNADGTIVKYNVWDAVTDVTRQYQDFGYEYDGLTNDFRIDIEPVNTGLIPGLQVFVNFVSLQSSSYQIFALPGTGKSISINPTLIKAGDRIDLLVYSNQVSAYGSYIIPDNLNYNSQNSVVGSITLGQMRNHIGALTKKSTQFDGTYPGVSNLRDLNIVANGGTILQQSSPVPYASMFLCDSKYDFVKSVYNAQQEYGRFKNKFITQATNSNTIDYADPVAAVDIILQQINRVKNRSFPWYYSDMVPYGTTKNTITYNVYDPAQRTYEITSIFDLTSLGNTSVLVYLNNVQLVHGFDYVFLTTSAGIELTASLVTAVNDTLTIVEYSDTDGNYIPETPTKLGLYPKFKPEIVVDNTFVTPTTMIIGHDGSKTPVFGDFRDQLILELEKRIYNNIKVSYSEQQLSIYNSKPGKFRNTGYSLEEYNTLVAKSYLQWVGFNRLNATTNTSYVSDDPFTFNYKLAKDSDGEYLPGSWRACFEYFYDTQYPNTAPWEMLGFSEEPDWWQDTYGPAPYTGGNTILWNDLEAGYIAAGSRQGYDTNFARPGLSRIIPVDENGNIKPPLGLLTSNYYFPDFNKNWTTGNWSPTETAWRNSSDFAFAQQIVMAMTHPGKYFGLGVAVDKYRYNTTLEQYLVTDTNYRLTQNDIVINGTVNTDTTISRAASYLNWVQGLQVTNGATTTTALHDFIQNYTVQLAYKMAGFSDKSMLKVLAEQNSPSSVNESVIVPDDNFSLTVAKSTPVANLRYSGIIVKKTSAGFELSGYDNFNPVITILSPNTSGKYDAITGVDLTLNYYTEFNRYKLNIPYGTVFTDPQQVANVISGYAAYLTAQGFRFDYYDEDLSQIRDWRLSTKEFAFWVEQNWPVDTLITLSPFAGRVRLVSSMSAVDEIQNSFYGSKVMDQNFNILGNDAYSVVRDETTFTLTLNNQTNGMIGYFEADLVQFEHVMIFDNTTQFNDIIYNPNSGERQYRLKLVGNKTVGWNGRLSPEGYMYNDSVVPTWVADKDYLKGDLVQYKNFYYHASKNLPGASSFDFTVWLPVDKNKIKTGLLNNFATNAGMGKDYYDVDQVNIESESDLLGFGLIGFRSRQYLSDLGIDDIGQVKFYQGYIKQKGTLNAVNAIQSVSTSQEQNNIDLNEQWAFRVGAYGSLDTNRFVELTLDEQYVLNNPTSLEVLGNNAVKYGSIFTDSTALYNSSTVPFAAPFLLTRTSNSTRTDDILTAGYVYTEDVDYTIFNLNDVSTLNTELDNINIGTTIWCAIDFEYKWNAFYVAATDTVISEIRNALNNNLTVTTDADHGLAEDDVIIIRGVESFDGFYKVQSVVSRNNFTITYAGNLAGFSFVATSGEILKLQSVRVTRAVDINNFTPDSGWAANNKVWVDLDTSTTWGVYNKSEPWDANLVLRKGSLTSNGNFGTSLSVSPNGNFVSVGQPGYLTGSWVSYKRQENSYIEDNTYTCRANGTANLGFAIDTVDASIAVGAPDSYNGAGYVLIYSRDFIGQATMHQILCPDSANAGSFGYSLSMSNDYQWLYVGAPAADKVYVYGYELVDDQAVSFTSNGTANTFSVGFAPTYPELSFVSNSSTEFVYGIDYTFSGTNIVFAANAGPGTYVLNYENGYRLVDTISYANTGSQFGFSVASSIDGAQVLIGAPSANVSGSANTGTISVYDRSIENFIATSSEQYLFGGQRTPLSLSKVYVNNELQTLGIDYTIEFTNWVSFVIPPGAGALVTIETDQIQKIEEMAAATPVAGSKFGYSVDICDYNCTLLSGAPYYSSNKALGKFHTGTAYRLLNQGRVYGVITGLVQNPTVTNGDSIRLNDFEVEFLNTDLDSAVTAINNKNIPGVSASNINGYLHITSDSVITANKLRVLPGFGTALTDLGLDVFVQVEQITNPTDIAYDLFGQTVYIDSTSQRIAVASTEATTRLDTTFDLSDIETTFDVDSTNFKDDVPAGAVWILSSLEDSRSTIDHPNEFAYVQQLKPNSISLPGFTFNIGMKFGSAVDILGTKMYVGAKNSSTVVSGAGLVSGFDNADNLFGWDVIRSEEPKVDLDGIIKGYIFNAETQLILHSLDYIDPAKGKILGQAEQEITYKVDYDPAAYNNSTIDTVSTNSTYYWKDTQVGQVWWDLSTVRYVDYEQGSIKYRTSNWSRVFPGSSIDVYEWVESIYPPSRYRANGGNGVPKYPNDEAYVTTFYVDPATNQTVVKYYFWVKDITEVTANQFGRKIPTVSIANYIENPKSSGVKYFAAIRNDALAIYNVEKDVVGNQVVFHLDYASLINNNIIHSEYALLSEKGSKSSSIPGTIYNKLVDSSSGIDAQGNNVPDPFLPVQQRYGISIRPRQSMFVDSSGAMQSLVTYVNSVFAKNLITEGYDLTILQSGEAVPPANAGYYDQSIPTYETLQYVNINALPTGYSILVEADSTVDGYWTIYTKLSNNTWFLDRIQNWRLTDYWDYKDWYATGFDVATRPDYVVNTFADLAGITTLQSRDVVKVLNNGQNKWVLLQIFPNIVITVGVENGTIELSDALWDLISYDMGYDNDLFDSKRFDQSPSLEIRQLFTALKEDIFVNNLSQNFVDLFFALMYYTLNEQKHVDWMFKTSFVDVIQEISGGEQPQIYSKDNQGLFLDYIEEVKPYHTTVKEFVKDYIKSDNWNGYTTDFDLPAYFDNVLQQYRSPSGEFVQDAIALTQSQYRDWLLSYPYSIESIEVTNQGLYYTSTPTVTITGSTTNNNAVARAIVSNQRVVRIELLYGGSNYVTQPVITITGGGGRDATAYAKLGGSPVRKLKTTLIYDRTTYSSDVTEWAANTAYQIGDIVSYNNVAYQAIRGFTSGSTFVGNDLRVYDANNFENANDRIAAYYTPDISQPGKDYKLLQTGLEFPGVTVQGQTFTQAAGYAVGGLDEDLFDSLEADSEGTYLPSDASYDSRIESLFTDTALGTRPEDIIVDGSQFVADQVLDWAANTYYEQGQVVKYHSVYYKVNTSYTSGSTFNDTNLSVHSINPYTAFYSYAPEEMVPGRVYDTLDMTVTTLAVNAATSAYSTWVSTVGFRIDQVTIINTGSGYSYDDIEIVVSGGGGFGADLEAVLSDDGDGRIVGINIVNGGAGFTSVPTITINGTKTTSAVLIPKLAQSTYDTFEYRIFKDLNDNFKYLRVQEAASTTIAQNVSITSNTIVVADSSVLMAPNPASGTPGVVYIDGERITYFAKDDSTNTLSRLRRGTSGTGTSVHLVGNTVVDGSQLQYVPYSDNWTVSNLTGLGETTSGVLYEYQANITYIQSQLWNSDGTGAVIITVEEETANVTANAMTTESNVSITTEGTYPTPADGNGLYASTTAQALFIKLT